MLSFSKSKLIKVTKNIDPVTGYPFETPEMRKEIFDIISKAREEGKIVIFIDSDVDNLKRLNDEIGKKSANVGIRLLIEEKERSLQEKFGVDNVIVYRPQAGGDEFNTLVVVDKKKWEKDIADKDISRIFDQGVTFKLQEGTEVKIDFTYGMSVCDFDVTKNVYEVFRTVAMESEKRLFDKKIQKINIQLEKTIKLGKEMVVEEYIDMIVNNWGSQRLGRETLRSIIMDVINKVRG